jgi:hypothetical protein
MSIQLGDPAPDFEADSTEGRIRFHEWLGNDWGVFAERWARTLAQMLPTRAEARR